MGIQDGVLLALGSNYLLGHDILMYIKELMNIIFGERVG